MQDAWKGEAPLKLGSIILINEHHLGGTDEPQELLGVDYQYVQSILLLKTFFN